MHVDVSENADAATAACMAAEIVAVRRSLHKCPSSVAFEKLSTKAPPLPRHNWRTINTALRGVAECL